MKDTTRRIQTRIDNHGDLLDTLNLLQKQRVQLAEMPKVLDYIIEILDENHTLKSLKMVKNRRRPMRREQACIAQVDPETGKVIATYRNREKAAEAVGVSRAAINRAVDSETKTSGGYAWRRLHDWMICTTCGFEGQRSKYFAMNGKKNGVQKYKATCIKCNNLKIEEYKNKQMIKELQNGKNGKN
jgi:hypothetical protein